MKNKNRPFKIFFLRKPDRDDYLVACVSVCVLPLILTIIKLIKSPELKSISAIVVDFTQLFYDEFKQDIVYGLLITVIVYSIRLCCRLRKDRKLVNKLKDSVNKILVSVETKDENGKKRELFYLTEIINSQINIGEFKPDSLLIDQADKCKSILSVTESPIALWLDPTYLFFLICQSVNNIAKKVPQTVVNYSRPVKKHYETRKNIIPFFIDTCRILGDFMDLNSEMGSIEKLYSMLDNGDIRIYFMDGDEISQNKGLVEWFVATHDFAGIHLLIIDRKILQTENIRKTYEEMRRTMMVAENERLDFALRFYDNSELWYAIRNYTQLHDVQIGSSDDPSMKILCEFLKQISLSINNNNENLFYPNRFGRFNISRNNGDEYNFQSIILNEEKAQIIIDKQ